ncbi:MAG: AlkZ-related protein [Chloroflexota bacterium]
MTTLDLDQLKAYRAGTFGLLPSRRVSTPEEARAFVDERGFVFFWPISSVDFPSLWAAVAGDRPVPNEHDDPGHVTWRWKDDALDKRIWYYAKVLRRKATMISLEFAPYFYALSENYGSPEEDYLIAYREGRLPQSAKLVYEAILDKGPLNTIDLRREAKLVNARDAEFNKALELLQSDFKILPIGIAEAGAWRYAFIYEITARYYPELPEQARMIGEAQAREKLLDLYFKAVGAAQLRDANKLFRWGNTLTERTARRLAAQGKLAGGLAHPQFRGEWFSAM